MMTFFKKIGLVGSGNVAYSYSNVLSENGIKPSCILVHNPENVSKVEKEFGIHAVLDYNELSNCDLIIIAVRDDAIKEVASRLKDYKVVVVHTSGSMSSSVLKDIAHHGIIYPLQTLTKDYRVNFKNVPLLITASSDDDLKQIRQFASLMSNVVINCSDEDRRYIHMTAVYVCNFVNVMLQIGEKLLKNKDFLLTLLEPLVRETIDKAFVLGPENALTGPARRGDIKTIAIHENLLQNNPEEKKIYELMTSYILNKYCNK